MLLFTSVSIKLEKFLAVVKYWKFFLRPYADKDVIYTPSISGLNNELVSNTRRPHLAQEQLIKTNLLHFLSWSTLPSLSGITFSLLDRSGTNLPFRSPSYWLPWRQKLTGSGSHTASFCFQALIKFKNHLYFEEKDLVDKAEKVRLSASPSCSCLLWLSLPLFSKWYFLLRFQNLKPLLGSQVSYIFSIFKLTQVVLTLLTGHGSSF